MDELIHKMKDGQITIDSATAEHIARLWFLYHCLDLLLGALIVLLIAWGIRTLWREGGKSERQ